MQYDLCRHLKTNGTQCKSPALSGRPHCFFHDRLHHRHSSFRHTPQTAGYLLPGHHIELLPLEDRESIQVSLSVVINALATGQLEPKRATALLYGLQLASMNATRLHLEPFPAKVALSYQSTPDGITLAEPGATGNLQTEAELALELQQLEDEDDPSDPAFPEPDDEDLRLAYQALSPTM